MWLWFQMCKFQTYNLEINILSLQVNSTVEWMPVDLVDGNSTLVHVMAGYFLPGTSMWLSGKCTEAHKGHHCKYFFRKVFFISARFFFISARLFFISARFVLFPQGLFYFRKVYMYLRKVLFISARFVSFPQGYIISARFILFPQGLFYFRKVILISAKIFSMVTTRVLLGPGHLA